MPSGIAGSSNEGFITERTADQPPIEEADESKVELGLNAPDADEIQLIKKNSFKARWGKLKRRLSLDTEQIDKHTLDDNEILPDDLEYIDGGEIVHAEVPPSPVSQQASKHSLEPLAEEKDAEKAKGSENKSNNSEQSEMRRRSQSPRHSSITGRSHLSPKSSETRL